MRYLPEKVVTIIYYHCHFKYTFKGIEYYGTLQYIWILILFLCVSSCNLLFRRNWLSSLSHFYVCLVFSVVATLCIAILIPNKKIKNLMEELTEKEKSIAKYMFWGGYLGVSIILIMSFVLTG